MAGSLYSLEIRIRDIRPAIRRKLVVPGATTLADLHDVLQIAFDWSDSHLHQFVVGKDSYGRIDFDDRPDLLDERVARLEHIARVKSKLVYEYDFGEGWEHDIVVESVELALTESACPVCLEGSRAAPPEDCGGPWGYAELLEALRDPKHPEHQDRLDWLGDEWKPETFDLDEINAQLQDLGARWARRDKRARGATRPAKKRAKR